MSRIPFSLRARPNLLDEEDSLIMIVAVFLIIATTTVHSEKDERWLWRAPVFGDFVVHCAVLRDSKLEKGSKKVPQLRFEPQMYCYASGVNGLDFHGFSPIQCCGCETYPLTPTVRRCICR